VSGANRFSFVGLDFTVSAFLGVVNHSVKYAMESPVFEITRDFTVTCQIQGQANISVIIVRYQARAAL
jgi:hypothetical protein